MKEQNRTEQRREEEKRRKQREENGAMAKCLQLRDETLRNSLIYGCYFLLFAALPFFPFFLSLLSPLQPYIYIYIYNTPSSSTTNIISNIHYAFFTINIYYKLNQPYVIHTWFFISLKLFITHKFHTKFIIINVTFYQCTKDIDTTRTRILTRR